LSDLDERIRKAFEGATAPADPAGAFERVTRKRAHRRVVRRAQTVALTVAVLVVTSTVTFSLGRMFGSRREEVTQPAPRQTPAADIAFAGEVEGKPGIYAMRADGTDVRSLTKDPGRRIDPSWSPDGTQLAFQSDRDGDFEIYVLDVASGEERQVTNDPADDTSPAWSLDGTKLTFVSQRDAATHLYMIDAEGDEARGSDVTQLTFGDGSNFDPAWSADGTQIYFAHDPLGGIEHSALYVLNVPSASRPEPVPPFEWGDPGAAAYQPAPSPDGTKIAFVGIRGGASQVFVADPDGTDVRPVTQDPTNKSNPSWSPDGRQIVFSAEGEDQNDLFVVNADGTGMRPITLPGDDVTPAWNPTAKAPEPAESPSDQSRCLSEDEAAGDVSLRKPGSLHGDVDGDGLDDEVWVAIDTRSEELTCRYFLVVETAEGRVATRIDLTYTEGTNDELVTVQSLVDIDDKEGLEVFVHLQRGLVEFGAIYTMSGRILAPAVSTEPDGVENGLFSYGGGESAMSGVDCTGKPGIIVVSGAHRKGNGWVVERNYLRLEGSEFRLYEQSERYELTNQELEESSLEERFHEFEPIAFPSCPRAVRAG
jgi:WD40 repeat protein